MRIALPVVVLAALLAIPLHALGSDEPLPRPSGTVQPTAQPSAAAEQPTQQPVPNATGHPLPSLTAPGSPTPEPGATSEPAARPGATTTPYTGGAPTPTAHPGSGDAERTVPYLVTFRNAAAYAERRAVLGRAGLPESGRVAPLRLAIIELPFGAEAELAATLRSSPGVLSVERDGERAVDGGPSDARHAEQWALERIGWPTVWGSAAPAGAAVVAILDTGVDASHPDLAGQLIEGVSFVEGASWNTDPHGHGTSMAGIVAAATGNDEGIAGVAFAGARVMPVTVIGGDGIGRDSGIIAGLVHAVDAGADVVLMAFSSEQRSTALQRAIDYAWTRGTVLVAPVGNGGGTAPTYPAGHAGVIGVAATDPDDRLWSDSNHGPAVMIGAPGSDILSTAAGGGYGSISGTSAAAAHVAGAAALVRAGDASLSNAAVVSRLTETAFDVGVPPLGSGRLDLAAAWAAGEGGEVEPPGSGGGGDTGGDTTYEVAAANVPTVTNASSAAASGAVTTLSWSHTTSSGSNRLLIVGFQITSGSPGPVSSITYNGTALTYLGDRQSGGTRIWVYYLVDPPVGTYTITASYNKDWSSGGAVSLTGVNQSIPLGPVATSAGTSTLPSLAVSSAVGERVVAALGANLVGTATVGTGETQHWNQNDNNSKTAGSSAPGASSVTMNWTLASSVAWAMVGASVKPATTSWTGAVSNLWSDDGNWTAGAPRDGYDVVFPAGASNLSTSNDLAAGTSFNSVTVSGTGYTLAGNSIALAADGIDVTNTTGINTISLIMTGSGGLVKTGAGALVLSGANTFTGGTTMSGGTLAFASGTVGAVTSGPVGTGALTITAGTIEASGAARTVSNPLTYGGNFTIGGSNALTLSGAHTVTADRTITVTNSALTTFSGGINANSGAATRVLTFSAAGRDLTFTSVAIGGTQALRSFVVSNSQTTTLNSTSSITVNGTTGSKIDITASRNVNINGDLVSNGGAITLTANTGGTTTGTFVGVNVATGATLSSGAGAISLSGKGGDTGNSNHGVRVTGAATVQSTSGPITLNGTGGPADSTNYGVHVSSAGTTITSGSGNISITGLSTGLLATNSGIRVESGALVESTGAATITIDGTGGPASSGNSGVVINNNTTIVRSANGNISITGRGNSDGSSTGNRGVHVVNGATVSSTGTATITIDGTGGPGAGSDFGVEIAAADTNVTSASGAISITGVAGNNGSSNVGVRVVTGAAVVSTSTAAITIHGTGGAGTSSNHGVQLTGLDSRITSLNGPIDITAFGGAGSSTSNIGLRMENAGYIASTGSATITVNATGGAGTSANVGVHLTGATAVPYIASASGSISITGTGAATTGSTSEGIRLESSSRVESTGSAAITLDGRGALGSAGVRTVTGINVIGGPSASGPITITASTESGATSLNLLTYASIQSTGALLLQPLDDAGSIGLGDSASGTFNVTTTELASLVDGFSSITVGRSTGQHAIDVHATTFNDPLTIRAPSGGGITVNGAITGVGNASVTLTGTTTGGTTLHAAITTAGTNITINGKVVLGQTADLTLSSGTGAGNVSLSGTVDGTAGGVDEKLTLSTGTGSVSLSGAVGAGVALDALNISATGTTLSGSVTLTTATTGSTWSGTVNLNGGTRTLNIGGSGANSLSIGDVVSNGGLTKSGTGLLVLSGANTYASTTTLSAGTLALGVSSTGAVTNGPVGIGTLALNGGAIHASGGTRSIANALTLGGNFIISGSDALTFSGAVTVTGNRTVTLTNSALTTFSGAVNADAATNNRTLTLSATGSDVTFSSAIGATQPLLAFTVSNSQTTTVGSVTTRDAVGGGISLTASRQVLLNGNLASNNRPITLSANSAGTATGSFVGIDIVGITLNAGAGAVSISATGGADATTGGHVGVRVMNGAVVQTTTGSITLDGAGGAGANSNHGVQVSGGARVTTTSGGISISGVANGSGASNWGTNIVGAGTEISSTAASAAGAITIDGTGADGTTNNYGVRIGNTYGLVTSVSGNVSITGQGGDGSGVSNIGVIMEPGAVVSSTGSATIGITGTGGGASGGTGNGVQISGDYGGAVTGTDVTSTSGAVTIIGTGSAGGNQTGVLVSSTARIMSSGSAPITIDGRASGTGLSISHTSTAGTLGGSPAGAPITLVTTIGNASIAGVVAGSGTLVKQGTYRATLSAANNYTGPTRIEAGTLAISSDANLGVAPGSATPGHLALAGGTLATTATFSLGANRGIAISAASTIDVGSSTTLSYGGTVAGSGHGLTKAGAGELHLATAGVTVGDFTLAAGTVTAPGAGQTFAVAGNWTNDAASSAFVAGSGDVSLNGDDTQTVGGTFATTFGGLIIANVAGVSLGKSATVDGTLSLTSGNVTTGAHTLSISSSGAVSRTSGHVVGNLRRHVPLGNPSITFDIGSANAYTPLSLVFSGVTLAGDLTASTTAGDHPALASSSVSPTKSVNRYWTLTDGGITFTSYGATFTFVAADVDSGAATAGFIADRYSGGSWSAPEMGTRSATTTEASGMTGFGDFAVGEPALAAPSNLTATAVSTRRIDLAWTDNATDETGYAIEFSTDGTTYSALASLPADSTSHSATGLQPEASYTFRVRGTAGSIASPWTYVSGTTLAAPGGAADSYTVLEDGVLTVAAPGLLANDPDGLSGFFTTSKASDPLHGTVTVSADGSFTYTPNATYAGSDSFTYHVNDGTRQSDPVTVSIDVLTSAYVSSAGWPTAADTSRYLELGFPAYVPAVATVHGATFRHRYRPANPAETTCYYLLVYASAQLIATHGSAAAPVSCQSGSSYRTDTITIAAVDTVGEANALAIRLVVWSSGGGRSHHRLATIGLDYHLE